MLTSVACVYDTTKFAGDRSNGGELSAEGRR